MHELLILQILLHEVVGHGDVRAQMEEQMIFVLHEKCIVVILLYNPMNEKSVMTGMRYEEMDVMQHVLLLSRDIHVLPSEWHVKISMNVLYKQIIVIAMHRVPIHQVHFLVRVIHDLPEMEQ